MSSEPGCLASLWPKYRPSEAVKEEYGHWEAPDDAAAREAYLKSHAHHGVFDLRCKTKDLAEFGEGVQLYFVMLKYMAALFSVLAIVPGLLLATFNAIGGWYDEADLERTMLGNFGLLTWNGAGSGLNVSTSGIASRSVSTEGAVTELFTSTVNKAAAKVRGMDKRKLLVAMSALDLLGVAGFFIFGMYLMGWVRSRARNAKLSSTTIADYSVQVEGLPADTSATALKEYLAAAAGEGAEVVEVELCRCVDQLLGLVVERGEVVQESELALAVVQRKAEVSRSVPESCIRDLLYTRFLLEDITAAIRQEQAVSKTNEVVTAFVTFSTPVMRERLLRALPRSLMRQWRMKPESKFNNGGIGGARIRPVALDLSRAPEPSDIQYENLEYTRLERFLRAVATNMAKYLVLLVGFLLVSLAPAMRMGIAVLDSGPNKSQCGSCSYMDSAGNYVLSAANRILYKECDPQAGTGALPNKLDCEGLAVCYECFCRAALNAGSYGEVSYCSRFSSVVGFYTLAQALAVGGVVLANAFIEFAITWLVKQEKHHTRTREAVGVTRGLFLTALVNTGFTNLLANMYLPGPAAVIRGSFLSGYIFTGAFADTTPNWFHDVCRPITISIFLTTVIVHLKIAFRWLWRRRCLCTRYQCLTQWQLDQAYEGHNFELAIKYGQHLYVIYVVMAYSGGVPLLYMLAAVHFTTCYWSEKYELLRLCKRPLAFSRDLAVYFSSSLPFAALWHLAFGVWFYSLFGVPKSPLMAAAFRRILESGVAAFKGLMPVASSLTPQLVAWRFTQNSSAHLFMAFAACAAALFIFFTTSTWLKLMRMLATQLGLCIGPGPGLGSKRNPPAAPRASTTTTTSVASSATNEEVFVTAEGEEATPRPAPAPAQEPQQGEDEPLEAFHSVPEFGVAVRSQLLVGPASYAVQQNPAYKHAFVRMEELEWEERKELEAKAAADKLAYEAAAALPDLAAGAAARPSSTPTMPLSWSGRKRTPANRLRAKQRAAAAMVDNRAAAGGAGAAVGTAAAAAVRSNQVLPVSSPDEKPRNQSSPPRLSPAGPLPPLQPLVGGSQHLPGGPMTRPDDAGGPMPPRHRPLSPAGRLPPLQLPRVRSPPSTTGSGLEVAGGGRTREGAGLEVDEGELVMERRKARGAE